MELLRPPALRSGDRVAVVALSSPVPADRLDAGLAVLRGWGLEVAEGPHLRHTHPDLGYLAGPDADRATDFASAWLDPDVAAVFCARGGYGVPRLLDLLDWDRLVVAPAKPVVGFSDVTPLLHALGVRLGVSGVHGPAVTGLGDGDEASRAHLWQLLFEPGAETTLAPRLQILVPGRAQGRLVGGNLALLASSVGTADLLPARGSIAVLEDVDENPYRVDRALTQLLRSGWFAGVRGIVLGGFTACGDPDQVRAVLRDRLVPLGVPLAAGAPIGHDQPNLAFPMGAPARLAGGILTLHPRD
jgi:muramoyltetrapeptide carboxypeptidase